MDNKPITEDLIAFDKIVELRGRQGFVSDRQIEELHPLNPETGLPTLPEHYFWRVMREYKFNKVALMFRSERTEPVFNWREWFGGPKGSRTVVTTRQIETYPIRDSYSDPVEAIFEASASLLSYMAGSLPGQVEPLHLKSFYGDYPPKSIHTAETK